MLLDFGAHLLQPAALTHICDELGAQIEHSLSPLKCMPSVMVVERMNSVWSRVMDAILDELYSDANVSRALKAAQKEDETEVSVPMSDSLEAG